MPDATPKRGRPRKPPTLHPDSQLTFLRDCPENPRYAICSCACGAKKVRVRRDLFALAKNLSCGHLQRETAAKLLAKAREKRWV
jgi:hypothetical protein